MTVIIIHACGSSTYHRLVYGVAWLQGVSHVLFESFRKNLSAVERRALFAQMQHAWSAVEVPRDVQVLGRLRKFPPPSGMSSMTPQAASDWSRVVLGTEHALRHLRRSAQAEAPLVSALFRYVCLRRSAALRDEDQVLSSLINLQRKADLMYKGCQQTGQAVSLQEVRPCCCVVLRWHRGIGGVVESWSSPKRTPLWLGAWSGCQPTSLRD